MFGIVFLWTPPHFWALALMIREHYANASVPMLPVVARRPRDRAADRLYTVALVVATLVPVGFGVFGLVLRRLGARARRCLHVRSPSRSGGRRRRPHAVKLFHFSMLYLALLFVAMALDAVV